jgi:hypothetical protein
MPRTSTETFLRKIFKAALDADVTEDGMDYDQIADVLATKGAEAAKSLSKKSREEAAAATAARDAAVAERLDAATTSAAVIATLRARIAELEAAPKTKTKDTTPKAPKHGRMQNQILKVNLNDGETVYRKVGGTTHTAVWRKADATLHSATLDKTFGSPSAFAKAVATAILGTEKEHAVNGWDVCWVERDGKKYKLSALRTAAAPPEETGAAPAEAPAPAPAPANGGAGAPADEYTSGEDSDDSAPIADEAEEADE